MDKIMKLFVGIALATLAFVGTASAAPSWQTRTGPRVHASYPTPALRDPETTGSLAGSLNRTRGLRDVQGRDFRSSTRGNAQFPERLPAQQNLGGTAGGPEF
ncbi:hypothetical protein PQI07_35825 [Methylobacterium sp. 092160098-2]|uniref:hypothetical protein n=1 Tax=Methylobacterium sp. 092160098-2 TaxID=3025129 RepID=UPI002381AC43|nr:hypothetical protein [Methylobacterium sp. 092160098-2]MDE4915945.1 hypothetical protein [Methylobacterium sp. 092160098-2]